ncbi:ABC transporter permease [Paenibacillus selenitireducens]|uniref:ABC transporter permease n=1 Tax=Paenibacillus selenitireducens TaxID=1324314 RepID=A0A1T2X265_9BACL|nr:ABC transporter permease [Paenibacillus selenitireducens]OPA73964.1 ABC transporter permease [Paenibacillus selenitireducens]
MRTRALAQRIIRQFLRDKRTLALIFIAPLLILTLLNFVFNGQPIIPKIGTVGVPEQLTQRLTNVDANVTSYSSTDEANQALKDGNLDAVISIEIGKPSIVLEGSDPTLNKATLLTLQKAMQAANAQAVQPAVSYLHGTEDMSSFDSFGPVLIGFFSFFFVFMIAGVSFLRERTTGTMERLLATPIRRSEVVGGYLLGFGVFTLLQAALITWFSISVLGMYMVGAFWLVLLINLLLTLTALTLGTLLSSFATTEFQIIQFIPIVIVPQVFFSGLFNLDAMTPWLQKLSYIMPLYYGADAMRGIMIRGESIGSIQLDIYVLLGFSITFALLNIIALKKQRSI